MIRLVLAAAALLTVSAAPAPAQEAPNPLGANWRSLQTDLGNIYNGIARLVSENTALQQQTQGQNDRIKALEEKCGAPCQDTPPQAQAPTPSPEPPKK